MFRYLLIGRKFECEQILDIAILFGRHVDRKDDIGQVCGDFTDDFIDDPKPVMSFTIDTVVVFPSNTVPRDGACLGEYPEIGDEGACWSRV